MVRQAFIERHGMAQVEDTMIRRNVFQSERDPRVVKWSLLAAALALSLGGYAEMVISEHADAQPAASVTAEDTAHADPPPITIARYGTRSAR